MARAARGRASDRGAAAGRRAPAGRPWRAAAVAAAFAAALCAADAEAGARRVLLEAPPPQRVASCAAVTLEGRASGLDDVRWELPDEAGVALDRAGIARARFRAPAVLRETALALTLSGRTADGGILSDTTEVVVAPGTTPPGLAPGMLPDCAPFAHGVASGDPRPDGVVIWTRVTPNAGERRAPVTWEVAEDPGLTRIVARGLVTTDAARDHTVEVDVGGLQPSRTYWFRFRSRYGLSSPLGRTRTAPATGPERLRFAVLSCSSIFSGWFNGYRRIAERPDLDAVIHLGDYIYDSVDPQERVRLPEPLLDDPSDLASWRARHAYYLTDPDLRVARARHPWIQLWDNHDVERGAAPTYNGSVQAFLEWNPIREPDPARTDVLYRRLHFGDLVDVLILDSLLHRTESLVPGSAEPSMLGATQMAWLEGQLADSRAAWRILGNQKVFGTVAVDPRLAQQITGDPRPIFDPGSWDGFPATRTQVLELLGAEAPLDNVVVSGDSHVSVAQDLVDTPLDPPYDPATGEGSRGVEILPTSLSRGNFDEELSGLGFDPRGLGPIIDFLRSDTLSRNPHHAYLELTSHGYGILDVTAERIVGEFWYSPILAPSELETLGRTITVPRGANRWSRQ